MSTVHLQLSTHDHSDIICENTEKRGIETIKTYADDGKNRLSIGARGDAAADSDQEAGAARFNEI